MVLCELNGSQTTLASLSGSFTCKLIHMPLCNCLFFVNALALSQVEAMRGIRRNETINIHFLKGLFESASYSQNVLVTL